ncbi:hypothetical protein B0H10DRAFT_2238511 [Mycena sp. CBHHK59/15]|nr:hypothetical protein B0H10DRAFT_2238511 [Mycena sp. CBHHK59/15]
MSPTLNEHGDATVAVTTGLTLFSNIPRIVVEIVGIALPTLNVASALSRYFTTTTKPRDVTESMKLAKEMGDAARTIRQRRSLTKEEEHMFTAALNKWAAVRKMPMTSRAEIKASNEAFDEMMVDLVKARAAST